MQQVGATGDAVSDPVDDLLARWANCSPAEQARLMAAVYGEIRQLGRRSLRGERADHTLQPTDLANEVYVKLRGLAGPFHDRQHFFAIIALLMRRILVDHARARMAKKRTPPPLMIDPSPAGFDSDAVDLLSLDSAMTKLRAQDPRKATVIELAIFSGLEQTDIAAALGVSLGTVERDLRMARAFLKVALR